MSLGCNRKSRVFLRGSKSRKGESMNVIFEGDFTASDRQAMLEGILLVITKLILVTDYVVTPEDAFRCLLGEITVEAVARCPGGWDAYVAPGVPDRIQFKRGKVTARLVIHELGHIINDTDGSHD